MGTAKTALQLGAKISGQSALRIAVVQFSLANVLCFYFEFPLMRRGFYGAGKNCPAISCKNARSRPWLGNAQCFRYEFSLIAVDSVESAKMQGHGRSLAMRGGFAMNFRSFAGDSGWWTPPSSFA